MVSLQMRGQVDVVCRCLAKLDERSQENGEFLIAEARGGKDFDGWLRSSFGAHTWSEIMGAVYCAAEVGGVDTRSLAKFAIRALEQINVLVDAEIRRRQRNATPPPARKLHLVHGARVMPPSPVPVIDEAAPPSSNWRWKMGIASIEKVDGRGGDTVPAPAPKDVA